jgi:hypothetical protein
MMRTARGPRTDMPLSLEDVCARLEAAAAAAPTIRTDGKFVFSAQGVCRVCGCTDERACPGGCVWAEPNLCSRCARHRRTRS